MNCLGVNVIKKFLLAGVAVVFTASGALAADISEPAAYDWSGPYAGLIAGYSWSSFDVDADEPDDPPRFDVNQSFDVEGGLVGVEAGWNYQMDSVVLGIAGDIAVSAARDSSDFDVIDGDEIYIGEHEWLATLRAKAGFAMDNVLVYATGGLAGTQVKLTFEDQDVPVFRDSDEDTLWGWTAGGGVEVALGEIISLKAEYLYADFGSMDYNLTDEGLAGDLDVITHMVRGGVLVHF